MSGRVVWEGGLVTLICRSRSLRSQLSTHCNWVPYIVLAQFRLELTRAQLSVPCLQQMLISCPLWQGRLVTVQ